MSREILKATLAFYLRKQDFDFEGFWDSMVPCFEPPQPPRTYMLWTWELLFPGETWANYHPEAIEDRWLDRNILHRSPPNKDQKA